MHDQVQAPNAQAEIEEVIEKNIKGQVEVNGQVEGNDEPGVKSTLIFKCLEAMEVNEVAIKKLQPRGGVANPSLRNLKKCSLYNIVATGTSMKTDDPDQLCHGYPLGDQNVRVTIEIANQEHAKVPFPVGDDIKTVRKAMGSWIAWRENLVIYTPVSPLEQPQKKKEKRGVPFEIIDLKADALNAPIQLKMLCMWGADELKNDKSLEFFIEPESALGAYCCGAGKIKGVLRGPLRRRLPIASTEWKYVINSAIAKYNTEKGRPSLNAVAWKNLGGVPHQPDHIQCGFYVMRFIQDIIHDQDHSFVTKWDRRNKLVYTQDDLDVLKNKWAKFIISKYM
ncbi:hypothetical protein ACLB2K_031436 [Fragaria x ananassa]